MSRGTAISTLVVFALSLNLRPAARQTWGFDDRQARSLTDRADDGRNMPDALEMAAVTASLLHMPVRHVLVGSTGRIGVTLPMENVRPGIEHARNSV